MTLSGMSNLQQVKDNIATYEEGMPLADDEMKLLLSVADDMIRRTTVPCTACHYCVSHCPMQLSIHGQTAQGREGAEPLPHAAVDSRSAEAV